MLWLLMKEKDYAPKVPVRPKQQTLAEVGEVHILLDNKWILIIEARTLYWIRESLLI